MTRQQYQETKKELGERFKRLYPNKRLLAVILDGFTHTIIYDTERPRANVDRENVRVIKFSSCMSNSEAQLYGMNEDRARAFFIGYPNFVYQNNAVEILYKDPRKNK